jgi:hypothetical protein
MVDRSGENRTAKLRPAVRPENKGQLSPRTGMVIYAIGSMAVFHLLFRSTASLYEAEFWFVAVIGLVLAFGFFAPKAKELLKRKGPT